MKHDDNHLLNEDEKLVKKLMSQMVVSPTEDMKEKSFQLGLTELKKTRQKNKRFHMSRRWIQAGIAGIAVILLAFYLPHVNNSSHSASRSSSINSSKKDTADSSNQNASLAMKGNEKMNSAHIVSPQLGVNHVMIGNSYTKLIQQFGKPIKRIEYKNHQQKLYYNQRGAGVVVQTSQKNTVENLQVFPEYLDPKKLPNLPFTKQDAINMYGIPSTSNQKSCDGTATCQALIYRQGNQQLSILLGHDGKSISVLVLSSHGQ